MVIYMEPLGSTNNLRPPNRARVQGGAVCIRDLEAVSHLCLWALCYGGCYGMGVCRLSGV